MRSLLKSLTSFKVNTLEGHLGSALKVRWISLGLQLVSGLLLIAFISCIQLAETDC